MAWTCLQLIKIIPNGDTVIDYGDVVKADDKGYTDLRDALFKNINSKAKEFAPKVLCGGVDLFAVD